MLTLEGIYKSYFRKNILKDIHLKIPPGKLIGLLGPNGSGKTSLLKLILRITKPTKGAIKWNDMPITEKSMHDIAGFLEGNPFPYWMRIKDAKDFYQLYFKDFDNNRYKELMDYFEMDPKQKIVYSSKGNLSKVKLMLILSRRAKLYLLDEPTEGLDLVARKKFLKVIVDTFNPECSMIMASHFVEEMEQMFTDAIFLKKGQVELIGETEELRNSRHKSVDEIYLEMFQPCGN